MGCPSPEELLAFLDGALPAARLPAIEEHLDGCDECGLLIGGEDPELPLAAPVPDPLPVAGRYRILEPRGSGGMGIVYLARDLRLERDVALKFLRLPPPAPGLDPADVLADRVARLEREAQALARVAHPHVVNVFDVGTVEGRAFVAMEYVDGPTLAEWLVRERPGWQAILDAFVQAARGLAAVHAAGLVHRDFKPQNVIVALDGRVRVTDFGLASAATRSGSGGSAGSGTPVYMAPEQHLGETSDARADQYAFCVALYEALHGRRPFTATDPGELLAAKLAGPPTALPPASTLAPFVHLALLRGLAPRPADRFPSLSELLDALAPRPPRLEPALRPVRAAEPHELQLVTLVALAAGPGRTLPATTLEELAAAHAVELVPAGGGDDTAALPCACVIERGTPGDQVARAARLALRLGATLEPAAVTLTTTRTVLLEGRPPAELIAACRQWAAALAAAPSSGPVILVDVLSAGLLESRFELGADLASDEAHGGRRLHGERPASERPRTLLGKLSPCVGRSLELALLSTAIAECLREGVPRAVLVTGPSGIGKSRLRQELAARLQADETAEVWIARADPLGAGASFHLLGQALEAVAGIALGDGAEVRRGKLRLRLAQSLPAGEVARVAAFLLEIVGPGQAGPAADPELERRLRRARRRPELLLAEVRRAWLEWLAAETAQGPLVLVLEDLHWADLPSLSLVEAALRELEGRPLLVLALARPEVHERFPRLWEKRGPVEIKLPPLTRRAAADLFDRALGESVAVEVRSRVLDRAEGNAFFLEELIRAVAEGKTEDLPATVGALAARRLDGLPPAARRLLRAASIFGRRFAAAGVGAVLGEAAGPITPGLLALCEAEILIDLQAAAGQGGEQAEYAFRHALMRDAAIATLSADELALAHRRAAGWLEESGQGEATVLAEHFEQGGEPGRAGPYYQRAADQALRGADLDGAARLADRGLACQPIGECRGELARTRAQVQMWRGDYPGASHWLTEAEQHLERGGPSWFTTLSHRLLVGGLMGRSDEVELTVRTLSRESNRPGLGIAHARASHMAAVILYYLGLPRLADTVIENFAPLEKDLRQSDLETVGRLQLARFFQHQVRRHDPAAALLAVEDAVACFEKVGSRRASIWARIYQGQHLLACGRATLARGMLEATWQEARSQGLGIVEPIAGHYAGLAAWHDGDRRAGRRIVEQNLFSFVGRVPTFEVYGYGELALLLADEGEAERSLEAAERALPMAPPGSTLRAQALIGAARARLMLGRAEAALEAADEARAIADEGGIIWQYLPLLDLWQGRAARACGETLRAADLLGRGRERVQGWAAGFASPEARQAFLEQVPAHAALLLEA